MTFRDIAICAGKVALVLALQQFGEMIYDAMRFAVEPIDRKQIRVRQQLHKRFGAPEPEVQF